MKKTALATSAVIALTSLSSAAFAQSNIAVRNRPEGLAPIASPTAKPLPNAKPLGPTAPPNPALTRSERPPQIKTMPAERPTLVSSHSKPNIPSHKGVPPVQYMITR